MIKCSKMDAVYFVSCAVFHDYKTTWVLRDDIHVRIITCAIIF